MRIGIIGAGAIGCLFGARLSKARNDVTLVHRDPDVVHAIRRGVQVREPGGRVLRTRVSAELSPADLSGADLVIFTVKSYDTENAARLHKSHIGKGSAVLTLQNGLGNDEILRRVFGPHVVLAGTTTEASLSVRPGEVVHTGRGATWVGELDGTLSDRCVEIARHFGRAQIKTVVSRNIRGVIWSKTIVNTAINPIAALTRLPNGTLTRVLGLREIMSTIVREGVLVSKAEKVLLEPTDPGKLLWQVLRATASNKSSMLQDVDRRKPTEVRQLNGAIARLGERWKVPTPLNQLLTSLVLGLELSYR